MLIWTDERMNSITQMIKNETILNVSPQGDTFYARFSGGATVEVYCQNIHLVRNFSRFVESYDGRRIENDDFLIQAEFVCRHIVARKDINCVVYWRD